MSFSSLVILFSRVVWFECKRGKGRIQVFLTRIFWGSTSRRQGVKPSIYNNNNKCLLYVKKSK